MSKTTPTPLGTQRERDDWRLLRIYAWYRFLLSLLLVGAFAIKPLAPVLGGQDRALFLATGLGYLVTTVSAALFLRQPRYRISTYSFMILLVDILALSLMTHATGTLNTQLGLLFLVVIAAGNILLSGRMGALLAAIAAISLLYEQFYVSISNDNMFSPITLAQTSIMGISFFAVALFSQLIAHRMREGEALVALRERDIADLQRLNEQVIRRMRTGILALNAHGHILLSNDSIIPLLGLSKNPAPYSLLKDHSPLLHAMYLAWLNNSLTRPIPFRNNADCPEVSASFARLNPDQADSPILLFLEDMTQLTQQAQQLKLASLGRLTASIAHEIRNPLGAISHATQLLAESEVIAGPDRRLLDIIGQHCIRMNRIIENILGVSRRQPSSPQTFLLADWLNQFRENYLAVAEADTQIELKPDTSSIMARFDLSQLEQVLHNLVMNGLRYSKKNTGIPRILLSHGQHELTEQAWLDIIDNGPGIADAQVEHLFEPFYTTESSGTGLGLYLSREICEANQARLDYIPQASGCCFRITFAHAEKLN